MYKNDFKKTIPINFNELSEESSFEEEEEEILEQNINEIIQNIENFYLNNKNKLFLEKLKDLFNYIKKKNQEEFLQYLFNSNILKYLIILLENEKKSKNLIKIYKIL